MQSDGYNCGVHVILTILDLVVTQWDKHWCMSDLAEEKQTDGKAVWKGHITRRNPVVLPSQHGIGTAFVPNPNMATKLTYKRFCNYIRMEMVLLMERVHC